MTGETGSSNGLLFGLVFRLVPCLSGGAAGGLLAGLVDTGSLVGRATGAEVADAATLVPLAAMAGVTAGLFCALLLCPLALRIRRSRWRFAASLLLAPLAIASLMVDATVYVGLYPEAHLVCGVLALAAASLSGALAFPLRFATGALLVAAVVAAAGAPLAELVLRDRHRIRAIVATHMTLTARVVDIWWTDPETGPPRRDVECTFPAAESAPHGGRLRGASVVLISIDALRADLDLAQAMPRLDARMADAVRFRRAYAAATKTNWSVYSLLTGRWSHRLEFLEVGVDLAERVKVFDEPAQIGDPRTWNQRHPVPLRDKTPTLAGILGGAGYRTATVVPYVFFLPHLGVSRGFQYVDATPYEVANRDNLGVTGVIETERALAWLGQAQRPFFLWLHYMDAHHPYLGEGVPESAPEKVRYLAELRLVDTQIDRLAAAIDKETVVVITADHGEEFGDHGGRFHGTTTYEEQLRVPLLILEPGGTAKHVDVPVSLVDLAPTLLDLLGIPSEVGFDGRSLVPWLDDRTSTPESRPLLGRSLHHAALILGDLKLIEAPRRSTVEVYDIKADARERRNLIDEGPAAEIDHMRCLIRASGLL